MNASYRIISIVTFSCALALSSGTAFAQTSPSPSPSPSPAPSSTPSDPCGSIMSIVNRPSITTGVCTVRPGHFVVENGYSNTTATGPGGGNTVMAGQNDVGIRFGTFDPHFDIEFTPPNYMRSSVGGVVATGSSDMTVGAKYELGYTDKALWGVAGFATVPSGTHAFTAGNAQFIGDFNYGYTLNSTLSLAATLSANALSGINTAGQPQSYFAFIPSLELEATLPGSPNAVFAEYAYFSSAGPNLPGKNVFDFGYLRDIGPHVQLDVEYGFSPTVLSAQRYHYIGAGISFMN